MNNSFYSFARAALWAVATAAFLFHSSAAWAQNGRQDAVRLFELTGVQANLDQVVTQTIETTKPMFAAMFRDLARQAEVELPPRVVEVLLEEIETEFRVSTPILVEMMLNEWTRRFSSSELRELIEFYATPLGRKLIRELPILTRRGMEMGQEWGAEAGKRAGERAISRLRAMGYEID